MKALTLLPITAETDRDPYIAYSYSYPHKSAYGPLDPPVELQSLWRAERREGLFLYVHVPFCEMRCGFCNLFARAHANDDLVNSYLATLDRQSRMTADCLGEFKMSRFALGGGTPTFLQPRQLDWLLDQLGERFRIDFSAIPTSIETSPKTATPDRLAILRAHGIRRVSIGVQSFDADEAHAIGRPQSSGEVHAALDRLRDFPFLNIDLIYGQPEQTPATWVDSIQSALRYFPEEIFLYPLYVRPKTGLGRQGQFQRAATDRTLQHYRIGRDLLLAADYEQISMRCFRARRALLDRGPSYCCQTDGMVGLGCGARSYTARVHYSSRFAVESADVQSILDEWIAQPTEDFRHARWGIRLSDEERRRRHLIQSLLVRDGLDEVSYEELFREPLEAFFPQLAAWQEEGLVAHTSTRWRLTARGIELSDHLGPALYSSASLNALEGFTAR